MTQNKDFKKLVRQRMEKTGESYTAARAQLLAQSAAAREEELAAAAAMSTASAVKATGMGWAEWVDTLDAVSAHTWTHRDIAKHVAENFDVTPWWSQQVTVGYERIKGLREVHQRRTTGTYEANKSKTFAVDVEALYKAFSTKRLRDKWFGDEEWSVRKATAPKSIRVNGPDKTVVTFYFMEKPTGRDGRPRATVQVQHLGLRRKGDIEKVKKAWAERFARLQSVL